MQMQLVKVKIYIYRKFGLKICPASHGILLVSPNPAEQSLSLGIET